MNVLVEQLDALPARSLEGFQSVIENLEIDETWLDGQIPADLPVDRYLRILLHAGSDYEVVLAIWPEGVHTHIHDHGTGDSHGMVRVLRGQIFNNVYEKADGGKVARTHELLHDVGDLIPVNKGLIHAMGNNQPGRGAAASLHFYSPVITNVTYWDSETNLRLVVEPQINRSETDDV